MAAEPLRLFLRRVIPRPVEEVFHAWTDGPSIVPWLGAGCEGTRVEVDPRVGGRLRAELRYQGAPWFLDGEFLELVPNQRLRFTWVTSECPREVGSVVTVTFRSLGPDTELTLEHVGFPDEETRRRHDAPGWQQILEVFVAAAPEPFSPDRLDRAKRAILAAGRGDTWRIELRRTIPRPAWEVFAAWTTPDCLAGWICPGGAGARVRADIRVGGRFHIDMLGPNGEVWPHTGEYLEVDPPRRLAFTWVSPGANGCPASLSAGVTLDFHDLGEATELVLAHFGFPDAASHRDHVVGWTEILLQLAGLAKVGFSAFGIAKSAVELRKLLRERD